MDHDQETEKGEQHSMAGEKQVQIDVHDANQKTYPSCRRAGRDSTWAPTLAERCDRG